MNDPKAAKAKLNEYVAAKAEAEATVTESNRRLADHAAQMARERAVHAERAEFEHERDAIMAVLKLQQAEAAAAADRARKDAEAAAALRANLDSIPHS
jgi:OOP family OmpA-OmpF porin